MEPLDAADRRLTRSALLVGAAAGSALAAGEFPSRLLAGSAWPSASAYTAEVPLSLVRACAGAGQDDPGFSTPVASRAFGYAGVALYEALVPGMPGAEALPVN